MQQGLVVFALNKARVSAFYQRTLGLAVIESDRTHDLLRGNGHEVVVHAMAPRHARHITVATPPQPRDEAAFKPTFVVTSLDAVREGAEATGGALKPAAGAWHFRGHVVLDGWDPEGNIVQFKQAEALA